MLRTLELHGFKSFADKTAFDFDPGITGVVGPNGSGKSNVVDAIKWILGDQSAKSLRGKEMTDVIFNGSTSRGAAQFAEATLVFDNRSRFLPVEQNEVAIGRRLWKSGDSEYLINRQNARLKDVRELFMGTGAGASAYCIIEQGRVDQILQSNAASRRLIFEEAAGISRFKQRRTEALRRLDRVEQNLLRLTDIVDEVERQVSSVRSQAQRAARYRELSTELKSLWVGLVADDYRRQSARRGRLEVRMEEDQQLLLADREQLSEASNALEAADRELGVVDEEMRSVERVRSDLKSRIASYATTLHHHSARRQEVHGELERLRRQCRMMDHRVREAEEERTHLTKVLKHEEEEFQKKRRFVLDGDEQYHALRSEISQLRQSIEQQRSRVLEQMQRNSDHATRIGHLQSRADVLKEQSDELTTRQAALRTEFRNLDEGLPELRHRLTQAAQDWDENQQQLDSVLRRRSELTETLRETERRRGDCQEERGSLNARFSLLTDLEERQEGFGIGVRDILERAEKSQESPWNEILGSVADLLNVRMEHAALLEAALTGRSQLLVVRKLRPVMDYLNSGLSRITGRVGFVSIETVLQSAATMPATDVGAEGEAGSEESSYTLRAAGDGEDGSLPIGPAEPELQESGNSADALWPDESLLQLGDLGASFDEWRLSVTWADPRRGSPVTQSVFCFSRAQSESLFGQPGVVGRADALAESPEEWPGLAAVLLADTWIVESLDDAWRLYRQHGGRYRFVTLQGEVVDRDGTLVCGLVKGENAVLSRKSELRRLRSEIHRLEHQIRQLDHRQRHTNEELALCEDSIRSRREAAEQLTELRQASQRAVDEQVKFLEAAAHSVESLANRLVEIGKEQQSLQQRLDDGETDREQGSDALTKLQEAAAALEKELSERQQMLDALEEKRTRASMELTRLEERVVNLRETLERLEEDVTQRRLQQDEAARRAGVAVDRLKELQLQRLNTAAVISELSLDEQRLADSLLDFGRNHSRLKEHRNTARKEEARIREAVRAREARYHESELQIQKLANELEVAADRIREEYQIDVTDAVNEGASAVQIWIEEHEASVASEGSALSGEETGGAAATSDSPDDAEPSAGPSEEDSESGIAESADVYQGLAPGIRRLIEDPQEYVQLRPQIEQRVDRLRRQIRKLGNVSTESLDNLNELETRYKRLHAQLSDLEAARDALREIVRSINTESRRMFVETFETIRLHFRELFRRLFGGGESDLILEDPEDVLECAIDVVVRPPGKELRSISLLSGGEKTMTAVALLMSIFKSRPSPFCILDEVDAALDDANIGRFVGVLKEFEQSTQFIMITHRKPTMAVTDVLYGVTMQESGISRKLSVRFEDVDDNGQFRVGDDAGAGTAQAA